LRSIYHEKQNSISSVESDLWITDMSSERNIKQGHFFVFLRFVSACG
jgi:hypothetical protein